MDSSNIFKYAHPMLLENIEYKEIINTQNVELSILRENINDVYKDRYFDTLTINGCKRWEKIMKITIKDSDTLEDRRFRIKNRFLNKIPYTMRSLENTLDTLCGETGYKVTYDKNTYTLTVKLDLVVKNQLDEVKRTLKYMVPTNIVQDISLLYNNHKVLSKYTHKQLSQYTHKQLREEAL